MSRSPAVTVEHLRKSYGPHVAIADVSLVVPRGEIFGVLGPNGAGKTTTVEAMVGLRPIDGGRIRLLGLDPHVHTRQVRERVGVQLQQAKLPPRLRVEEALRLYSAFYDRPADPADLMDTMQLGNLRKREFGTLSGGQQQRVSIALALVGNPEVAILDELTTGLDPESRRATWDVVQEVRDRGVTIVLVTHYMDEAEYLCDRLVLIDRGTVVAAGAPWELIAESDDARHVLHFTEPLPPLATTELRSMGATVNGRRAEVAGGAQALSAVLFALDRQGLSPADIESRRPNLEDVFFRSTGRASLSTDTTAR